jgi:hypothetical protein
MIVASTTQASTTNWATVTAVSIDTNTGGESRIMYWMNAVTADVTVRIQGSLNNVNWVDIDTRDITTNDVQGVEITVPVSGSAVAVISPEYRNGADSAWRYYRAQLKSGSGTLDISVFAK